MILYRYGTFSVTSTRVACQLSTYHEKEALKATGIQESFFVQKAKSSENLRQTSEKSLRKVDIEKEKEKDKLGKKKLDASTTSLSTKKGGKKTDRTATDEDLRNVRINCHSFIVIIW